MVNLQEAGMVITIFLMVAGTFMAIISTQLPDTGMVGELDSMRVTTDNIADQIEALNSDFENLSRSNLVTQIPIAGGMILQGLIIIATVIAVPFTAWINMTNLMFSPLFGTPAFDLIIPIQILLGFIMVLTIARFFGDLVRSLPFFGSTT